MCICIIKDLIANALVTENGVSFWSPCEKKLNDCKFMKKC